MSVKVPRGCPCYAPAFEPHHFPGELENGKTGNAEAGKQGGNAKNVKSKEQARKREHGKMGKRGNEKLAKGKTEKREHVL